MQMNLLDLSVVLAFFLLMLAIGVWAYTKNRNVEDYFVAGGQLPWWLSGISHHVSGYSGVLFVAHAGIAYTYGFTIYVWWAIGVGSMVLLFAGVFPVLWMRLRREFKIQSPLEYLVDRYDLRTQQIMAWAGVVLKLFDVGAKWAAIGVLMHVFTGIPFYLGVLVSGGVSLVYITFGGLWAVILTDFAQFLVQLVAGVVMFVAVILYFDGFGGWVDSWQDLPDGNRQFFNEPYTAGFALAFLLINLLSYNGGTWNLATRYISASSESHARNAALLSGSLFLVWPLVLYIPMWAAPLILPGLEQPDQAYGLLTLALLPAGLVGLVLASLFASTMSMTSSDVNTVSAVINRDILPNLSNRFRDQRWSLQAARITTFGFTLLTLLVALQYEYFGGVIGLIISWFGALIGPTAIPMLFGLLPMFKHCGPPAALASIGFGFATFIITKVYPPPSLGWEVGLPVSVAAVAYIGVGWLQRNKPISPRALSLLKAINPKM